MNKNILLAFVIVAFAACTNNKPTDAYIPLKDALGKSAGAATGSTPAPLPASESGTGKMSTGSSRLNPAHGAPGHRCEFAVGAPLPEEPATPAPPAQAQQAQVVTTAPAPPPPAAVTTKKSSAAPNPAHGQTGHRCDIPVGAPLDSKPMTQPTVAAPPPQKVVTAPGMNPPHGEPGHRCDIAVGAPLNPEKKTDAVQPVKLVEKKDSSNG